jgi:hypothetical protein
MVLKNIEKFTFVIVGKEVYVFLKTHILKTIFFKTHVLKPKNQMDPYFP